MKENRLKSWGFEEFPTEDPRIINYIGLESPENKMTSYEIFPGGHCTLHQSKEKIQR